MDPENIVEAAAETVSDGLSLNPRTLIIAGVATVVVAAGVIGAVKYKDRLIARYAAAKAELENQN